MNGNSLIGSVLLMLGTHVAIHEVVIAIRCWINALNGQGRFSDGNNVLAKPFNSTTMNAALQAAANGNNPNTYYDLTIRAYGIMFILGGFWLRNQIPAETSWLQLYLVQNLGIYALIIVGTHVAVHEVVLAVRCWINALNGEGKWSDGVSAFLGISSFWTGRSLDTALKSAATYNSISGRADAFIRGCGLAVMLFSFMLITGKAQIFGAMS